MRGWPGRTRMRNLQDSFTPRHPHRRRPLSPPLLSPRCSPLLVRPLLCQLARLLNCYCFHLSPSISPPLSLSLNLAIFSLPKSHHRLSP
eukprot:6209865-Pleurochrysis_carterae.AAC.1